MLPLPKLRDDAHQPLIDLITSVLVTPSELARHWRLSESHLSNQRLAKKGLPFLKLGSGAVRYRQSEIIGHELAQTRGPVTLERVALALSCMPGLTIHDRLKIEAHLREALAE